MLPLREIYRHAGRRRGSTCLMAWSLLLVGCTHSDPAEMERLYREWSSSVETSDSWDLAPDAQALPAEISRLATRDAQIIPASKYWGFSDDTRLVRLPCVDEADTAELEMPASEPLGSLLAPHSCPRTIMDEPAPEPIAQVQPAEEPELDIPMPELVAAPSFESSSRAIEVPRDDDLSAEERHLLDLITKESLNAVTGGLTDAQLDQQCRAKISAAYVLSQRGAAYAAREELIGVLRLISQAKDSRDDTRSRTTSLAAGLRALEEAEDFVPLGSQLEADMTLEVLCAAHRTPLARELKLAETLPSRIMDRYHRYAQIKLAVAVAGEPAGSIALYSLGKLNSLLAATEGEQHPLATRKAVACQQAALLAHNENYMAAHELGVLLAETGHFPEAQHLLVQVAAEQPNAIVFRNLARVQEALGNRSEAELCRNEATRLAQSGRGPRPNVSWVPPEEFSRNQMNSFTPQVASRAGASSQSASAVVWR